MLSHACIKKIMIAVVIILVIAIAAWWWFKPGQSLPPQVNINLSDQPTLGNAQAKVSIVAFEDLKCGNCKRFNTALLPSIKAKYITPGLARYTVINLAFIPGSMPAANAARCLYMQNKDFFFPFIDYVYEHQPDETIDWATIPTLMTFASHIPGVDQDKLSQCIFDSRYTDFIKNNLTIAQQAMTGDSVSTPTVYVNGRVVVPLTMERFDEVYKAAQKD